MSMERSETDEEEQAEMLIRAMTEKNVTKIEVIYNTKLPQSTAFSRAANSVAPCPCYTQKKAGKFHITNYEWISNESSIIKFISILKKACKFSYKF